jgi:hypothetical protein
MTLLLTLDTASDLYHLSLDGTRLATWKAKRWHLTDQGQRLGVVTALLPDPTTIPFDPPLTVEYTTTYAKPPGAPPAHRAAKAQGNGRVRGRP